jgi:hypothetical protein
MLVNARAGQPGAAPQRPALRDRGAFVIAAVLTPPDVISQLLLAIPLVLLTRRR